VFSSCFHVSRYDMHHACVCVHYLPFFLAFNVCVCVCLSVHHSSVSLICTVILLLLATLHAWYFESIL
jgi:hypothetical protein